MKVKELITLLEKVEDKEKNVKVAVKTFTQAYPVAYLEPFNRGYLEQMGYDVRIYVSFPEGYSVSQRKPKSTLPVA